MPSVPIAGIGLAAVLRRGVSLFPFAGTVVGNKDCHRQMTVACRRTSHRSECGSGSKPWNGHLADKASNAKGGLGGGSLCGEEHACNECINQSVAPRTWKDEASRMFRKISSPRRLDLETGRPRSAARGSQRGRMERSRTNRKSATQSHQDIFRSRLVQRSQQSLCRPSESDSEYRFDLG
jgi:hypothetical protein